MLLRALIPSGFMLGRDAAGSDFGLIFCAEVSLSAGGLAHGADLAKLKQDGHAQCVFALSALATPPPASLSLMPAVWVLSEAQRLTGLSTRTASTHLHPPSQGPPLHS